MTGEEDGFFFAFQVINPSKPRFSSIDTSYYSIYAFNIEYKIDEESGEFVEIANEFFFHPCTDSEFRRLGNWDVYNSE